VSIPTGKIAQRFQSTSQPFQLHSGIVSANHRFLSLFKPIFSIQEMTTFSARSDLEHLHFAADISSLL
jgi:hypothetical protein